jgi:hypothetical protein
MKQLFFIQTILILLTSSAFADTISVGDINSIYVADQFIGSSSSGQACEKSQTAANCNFQQTFTNNYLNDNLLSTITTSNFATSVKSPNVTNAYIDIAFSQDMFNGDSNDLVLFFVGNGTSFNLDVFSKEDDINSIYSETRTIGLSDFAPDTTTEGLGWLCINASDKNCTGGATLSAMFFDFGDTVATDLAIHRLRISFGDGFTEGTTSSNFSLAGGFHNKASISEVPLPLSAVLFSSGLALLSLFRRKAQLQS